MDLRNAWRLPTLASAILSLVVISAFSQAHAEPPPEAVINDPPKDAAHPAGMQAFQILSGGDAMNAVLYTAAGAPPHPTVLLLHGLPGNEQNLDLAQAIRRAGWNVLTMHYRGSWGSGGTFSVEHSIEDSQAAIQFLRDPKNAQEYGFAPGKLVVIGHSMGGFVAANAGATDPSLLGVGLLAVWNIGGDVPFMKKESEAELKQDIGDFSGVLVGTNAQAIFAEAVAHEKAWSLATLAPGLAKLPVLVVTPHRDDDESGLQLAEILHGLHAPVTALYIDTDHPFSDSRIAPEAAVIRWLATLPGAPSAP